MCDDLQIVPVSSNVSWANTPIIALYCTEYKALFGSVNLKQELSMKMSGEHLAALPCTTLAVPPNGPINLAPEWLAGSELAALVASAEHLYDTIRSMTSPGQCTHCQHRTEFLFQYR